VWLAEQPMRSSPFSGDTNTIICQLCCGIVLLKACPAFSPAGSERFICGLFAAVSLLSFPKLHYFLLSKCCHLSFDPLSCDTTFSSVNVISKFMAFLLSKSLE